MVLCTSLNPQAIGLQRWPVVFITGHLSGHQWYSGTITSRGSHQSSSHLVDRGAIHGSYLWYRSIITGLNHKNESTYLLYWHCSSFLGRIEACGRFFHLVSTRVALSKSMSMCPFQLVTRNYCTVTVMKGSFTVRGVLSRVRLATPSIKSHVASVGLYGV